MRKVKYSTCQWSLFQTITPDQSGITFKNEVIESFQNNILNNNYIYSGGGTAVGDVNNDGLVDILFVSNLGASHGLFLNQGNFKFKDVTNESGLQKSKGWCSGALMEDFNNDGYLDIYICKGGEYESNPVLRKNELFINNKNGTFTERAEAYGLADKNKSTQAVMFDYDNDEDLDLLVVNIPHRVRTEGDISIEMLGQIRRNPKTYKYWKETSDRLYKNNGNGRYVDATEEAGLLNYGFGLGVGIMDINKDGWQDIYITNDFDMDNFLYINNGGKFVETASIYQKHASYFAMGMDIADINNDGLLDIFEVEMLPENRKRAVENMASMNRNKFEEIVRHTLRPQYMRNTLHLNRGQGMLSEIAQLSGVTKTDWSWGTILLDLDDDGLRDIFVTNGIGKDMKNRDDTRTGNKLSKESGGNLTVEQHSNVFKSTKVQNYAFKNKDGIKFEKYSDQWGFDYKGFSNGLCYADFDNDGDMDLVVNNLNDSPIIYKNTSAQRGNNYINFEFKGNNKNVNGIGSKLTLYTPTGMQYHEHYTVRGFQSCSQAIMHFGLGTETTIDSLEVIWPNGKKQRIKGPIAVNQTMRLSQEAAGERFTSGPVGTARLLNGASAQFGFSYQHKEALYDDFDKEILIPHKMSQNGPGLATADVNKDGTDDVYIGGAAGFAGALFISQANGKYARSENQFMEFDKKHEDMGACFFDANGDGHLDLYVVSGSNEFDARSDFYQDRLYINDGKGNFTRNVQSLPKINGSGSCVHPADFDKDGDIDLFVGGRIEPGKYPHGDPSYLLVNENGKFKNIAPETFGNNGNLGMVTSAVWSDFDKDGDDDLFVVGEWMGIHLYENVNGKFKNISSDKGFKDTEGWWFKIQKVDIDNDGDDDYVCGNIGLNHKFKASNEKPFQVFCDDFDNTGTSDIVLAFEQDDKLYPVRGRDCSSEQMPFILDKYPTFSSFGDAEVYDIIGEKIESAYHKKAKTFTSIILINNNGEFEKKELPIEAQFSPIMGVESYDFDGDGLKDLVTVGNMFQTEAETSQADAGFGLIMMNKKNGNFEALRMRDSGFFVPGDSKDVKIAMLQNGLPIFVIANNNAPMQTYQIFNRKVN